MVPSLNRRDTLKAVGGVTILNALAFPSAASRQDILAAANWEGPVRIGRFTVEIDEVEVPGWRSVTIPSSKTEQGENREGDDHDHEKKTWGQTTYDDLEMERGFDPESDELYQWREQVRMGNVDDGFKEVSVTLLTGNDQPFVRWQFESAWIKEYNPPELSASNESDAATEAVILSFENMTTVWQDVAPDPEGVVSVDSELILGESVTLDAGASEPGDVIEIYKWDLGDGTTKTGETVTHTYESAGTYEVKLTVEGDGLSDTTTVEIDVQEDSEGIEIPQTYLTNGKVNAENMQRAAFDWEAGEITRSRLASIVQAWRLQTQVG